MPFTLADRPWFARAHARCSRGRLTSLRFCCRSVVGVAQEPSSTRRSHRMPSYVELLWASPRRRSRPIGSRWPEAARSPSAGGTSRRRSSCPSTRRKRPGRSSTRMRGLNEFGEVAHTLMGRCRAVMRAHIGETVDGVWPSWQRQTLRALGPKTDEGGVTLRTPGDPVSIPHDIEKRGVATEGRVRSKLDPCNPRFVLEDPGAHLMEVAADR